jgi:hypothetical protein
MQNEKWDDIEGDDNAPSTASLVVLSEKEKKAMIVEYYQDDIPDAKSPETTESDDGEDIIPDDYYQLARKSLIDQIQVTDLDLQQLAQDRANNIAHQLIQVGELPTSRVFVLKENVDQQAEPESADNVTVELTLTAS